ncbi:hypothetical protein RKD30_005026 [Streptomyces pristinaespiralis]
MWGSSCRSHCCADTLCGAALCPQPFGPRSPRAPRSAPTFRPRGRPSRPGRRETPGLTARPPDPVPSRGRPVPGPFCLPLRRLGGLGLLRPSDPVTWGRCGPAAVRGAAQLSGPGGTSTVRPSHVPAGRPCDPAAVWLSGLPAWPGLRSCEAPRSCGAAPAFRRADPSAGGCPVCDPEGAPSRPPAWRLPGPPAWRLCGPVTCGPALPRLPVLRPGGPAPLWLPGPPALRPGGPRGLWPCVTAASRPPAWRPCATVAPRPSGPPALRPGGPRGLWPCVTAASRPPAWRPPWPVALRYRGFPSSGLAAPVACGPAPPRLLGPPAWRPSGLVALGPCGLAALRPGGPVAWGPAPQRLPGPPAWRCPGLRSGRRPDVAASGPPARSRSAAARLLRRRIRPAGRAGSRPAPPAYRGRAESDRIVRLPSNRWWTCGRLPPCSRSP